MLCEEDRRTADLGSSMGLRGSGRWNGQMGGRKKASKLFRNHRSSYAGDNPKFGRLDCRLETTYL